MAHCTVVMEFYVVVLFTSQSVSTAITHTVIHTVIRSVVVVMTQQFSNYMSFALAII